MDDPFRRICLLHSRLDGFKRRVKSAKRVVFEALMRASNPYIAFSTGKDSVCTAHLVWEQCPDVPAVYFDADCAFSESSELLEYYEAQGRSILRWPTEPFFEILRRVGGPASVECEAETMRSTVYRPIQNLLKKFHFDGAFVGLRNEESFGRRRLTECRGQLFWQKRDGLWECLPIAYWTYLDVWAFIVSRGISYCAVYDRLMELGVPPDDCRLSYWAGETKRRWGRWAILKRGWPELFNRFASEFPEVRCYV